MSLVASAVAMETTPVHGPPTRPNIVAVGTIVWLSSELMFFAALFAMYFTIRAVNKGAGAPWPPPPVVLDLKAAAPFTIVLVLSSITCQIGVFAALGGEDADLAGDRGQHQDDRERRGGLEVEHDRRRRPRGAGALVDGPDREVHREQRGEEHQLRRQPDDGPHGDDVRPRRWAVDRSRLHCYSARHERHSTVGAASG